MMLHYNKLGDCKKGENRMERDGTKRFAGCGGVGVRGVFVTSQAFRGPDGDGTETPEKVWLARHGWMEMGWSGRR